MSQDSPVFRLYRGWSNDLRASELATLDHIDAATWLRTVVALLRIDHTGPIKVTFGEGPNANPYFLREPVDNECLIIRFLRYVSSEQLFALLLSGQNFLPYARFASQVRYQDLTQAYSEISQGLVPERFSKLTGLQEFEPWLAVKLGDWNVGALCPSLIRFIQDEARFLSDRTFINAIKHGRARTQSTANMIEVKVQLEGVWTSIFPISSVIWVEDWSENASGFNHSAQAETFDFPSEIGSLHVAYRLMEAMLNGRRAYLRMLATGDEACSIDFSLPCDIAFSAVVNRLKGLPAMFGGDA